MAHDRISFSLNLHLANTSSLSHVLTQFSRRQGYIPATTTWHEYLFHSKHATATRPAGARAVEGPSIYKEKKTGCTEAVAEGNDLIAAQNNISCVVRVHEICVVAPRSG